MIKLNHLLKKMSIDFSAKLHRWSIICNLISQIDGFPTTVFQSIPSILYVLFLHNHFVLKLNEAEVWRGETEVNPCFNSKAAILYKAEQEEGEQRQEKWWEETRKGSVS